MAKQVNVADSITHDVSAPIFSPDAKQKAKEKLQKIMREEMQMVKGIFQFFECPGMSAKITVKKYKEHFFSQTMKDGEEYEIPLYVARFLNGIDATAERLNGKLGTCSYPVHSYLTDKNGVPIISESQRKRRFGFQSLAFGGFEPKEKEKVAS